MSSISMEILRENLKEAMWIAARCTTMVEFNKAMDNLKKIDEPAWKELNELAAGFWTTAAFSTYTCCDLQVSNGSDAYVINLNEKTCACRKWDLLAFLVLTQLLVYGNPLFWILMTI